MNTLRGVARKTAASPRLLATVFAAAVVGAALLLHIARSDALLDDMALLLVAGLLAMVIYLQSDWALPSMERFNPEVVWRIPVQQRLAALTIDDVPLLKDPTQLEEILDVLREHRVTATLFVMSGFDLSEAEGGMVPEARVRCRQLLARAVAEGHELANHMQLDYPAIALSPAEFDRAFLHCDALLAELSGGEDCWRQRTRRWFRPASAMWSKHMLATARRSGYTTVIANCYPHDVAAVTRHINAAYLGRRVRPGAIIIVHDRWHTPQTLAKALPLITRRGMQLCTLSELQAAADAEALKGALGKQKEQ